ncbi:uncharacterized protein SAPINGB_P002282 [Magnusiomyces paraingens]|uniref:PPM-type phosphatase domain-containing protein n=1 Tax=Magnusiomyces paraingens TaxID=2606893 RepID=A0A5E8BIQ9_9ASCO|nr:uncharacterized protein SAPINGB_P002282 [Saprochaete ingens]VVT49463.1 unnamed protein product [Saprochaete ingens]
MASVQESSNPSSSSQSSSSSSSFFKSFKRKLVKPQQQSLQKQSSSSQPVKSNTTKEQSSSSSSPSSSSSSSSSTTTLQTTSPQQQQQQQQQPIHDCSFKVAVAEDYNLKYRQSMEDTHVYIYNFCDVPDAGYFAVFDGHAGSQASKWCSEHIHNLIRLWILRNEGYLPYPQQLLTSPPPPPPPQQQQQQQQPSSKPSKSPASQEKPSSSKSKWFKKSESPNTLKPPSSIFKTGPSPTASNSSRPRSTSISIASLSSSSSKSSSSNSSLVSHLAVKENQYPNIPPHQSIPRAFNAAFLEADSRMEKVVPASTGTTVAMAVIRWETPDKPEEATETSETSETPEIAEITEITEITENPEENITDDSTNTNLSETKEETKEETKTHSNLPPPEQTIPEQTIPDQQPSELTPLQSPENPSDSNTPDQLTPLTATTATTATAATAATATSLPLSKVATNKSVISRKSFNHSVSPSSRNRVLYTANVGDSRIVLCRGGRAFRLSYDHKGSDAVEAARITAAGGLMIANRVNGMLAVTRALGDRYMKSLVSGSPYTTRTVLGPTDEFIIVACDGLWDVCTDQQAVDLARDIMDPKEAARTLVRHAIEAYSSDNVTCMVIRLDPTVCEASSCKE